MAIGSEPTLHFVFVSNKDVTLPVQTKEEYSKTVESFIDYASTTLALTPEVDIGIIYVHYSLDTPEEYIGYIINYIRDKGYSVEVSAYSWQELNEEADKS